LEQIEHTDTQAIQKQVGCIADFFLQGNRTAITINNLQVCQPVIKTIQ
jgi:hypothetical protein